MEKQQSRDTRVVTKKTYQSVSQALQANANRPLLKRIHHSIYIFNSLIKIGPSIYGYDVGHPWLVYYIANTLHILKDVDHQLDQDKKQRIKKLVAYCQNLGFAGGHGQVDHLAPTYAAFLTILILGEQAFDLLDKEKLYTFFKQRKEQGKFHMHEHGECDLRGIYIVAIIAKMLGMNEDIYEGAVEEIVSCQTYEGGLTNIRGGEAHGGYTFCGVAALAILGQLHRLDISRLMFWLANRQVDELGGFNGRTNKLIDSCYSFWVGATFNIVNDYFKGKVSINNHLLYCQQNLQKYILLACQDSKGGLVDKPEKSRDLYHTCYSLTGLSLSQQFDIYFQGLKQNSLRKLDPIYNVPIQLLQNARKYFKVVPYSHDMSDFQHTA